MKMEANLEKLMDADSPTNNGQSRWLVGPVQQVTAALGKTTKSVRNNFAGFDVKSHRSETLESSSGKECAELELLIPKSAVHFATAMLPASNQQQISKT